MDIDLSFQWSGLSALTVRYSRHALDDEGEATRSGRWTWALRPADAVLALVPEQVTLDLNIDGRRPLAHRSVLDNLRDRPARLRVGHQGEFLGVARAGRFRREAGASTASLEALDPDPRRLIAHAASTAEQTRQARELWRALVGFWVEVERLTEGQTLVVPLPPTPLPILDVSVPMLLQVSSRGFEDGSVLLEAVNEPEPDALAGALRGALSGADEIVGCHHRVFTELHTHPDTLIPLRLQVRREDRTELQDPAGRRVTRRNDESRTWEFVASR